MTWVFIFIRKNNETFSFRRNLKSVSFRLPYLTSLWYLINIKKWFPLVFFWSHQVSQSHYSVLPWSRCNSHCCSLLQKFPLTFLVLVSWCTIWAPGWESEEIAADFAQIFFFKSQVNFKCITLSTWWVESIKMLRLTIVM